MRTWNFGILGPGKIANRFAESFQYVPGARVYAVASRDRGKAGEFAARFGANKQYNSYEALAKDPDVDIVYVATPHVFHHEQTILCLQHGKAVLCEKPMAVSYQQTKEMVDTAKANNVFLMEGMWSRFFPALIHAKELIDKGAIGNLEYITADFGFAAPVNYEGRLYNKALGGGAQWDVGVYPLFLSLWLLGRPDKVSAYSHRAVTGVDQTTVAQLAFRSGAFAQILSSIAADSPKEAILAGTKGRIHIKTPWYKTEEITLRLNSGETQTFPHPHSGNGFEFQLQAVVDCLSKGQKECPALPHEFSLLLAEMAEGILGGETVKR